MTARSKLALVTALAVLAIALAPSVEQPSVIRLAFVAVGIVAAWSLFRRLAPLITSTPERFEDELRQPVAASPDIPGLRAVDGTIRMALASSFGVEFKLRPLLRELTRWRLLRSRGIDIDATPDLARQTIGEPLWSLVQAAEPRRDYGAPGLTLADIRASIEQLERI